MVCAIQEILTACSMVEICAFLEVMQVGINFQYMVIGVAPDGQEDTWDHGMT